MTVDLSAVSEASAHETISADSRPDLELPPKSEDQALASALSMIRQS
jgi:hypothetical protein